MADAETEAEWEKSKRIEAERKKAAKDLEKTTNKTNLAYLEPQKAKGFARDPKTIMMSAERMANASLIFAILGIVFGIFSVAASMVSTANHLGLAGAALGVIIGIVNVIGIGVAALTAIVALISAIVLTRKTGLKVKPIIITSCSTLVLLALYYLVRFLLQ